MVVLMWAMVAHCYCVLNTGVPTLCYKWLLVLVVVGDCLVCYDNDVFIVWVKGVSLLVALNVCACVWNEGA